ncbi:MAG: transposase [Planctomycetota bacterium]|jgi:REP element-mobilizing transposase RayT
MPTPRRLLVDRSEPGYYHCISRCVRQAFLCGGEFEHRRAWIEERTRELASIFAIDVCALGVLSNHYHVILRTEPELAEEWTADEVRTRWKRLYPQSLTSSDGGDTDALGPHDAGQKRLRTLRNQLCDLSWFMRALNEYIARRANHEEGRTGRFWEGRFKSIRLLDEEALLQCSMYVDLNEIRSGLAETPEASKHSSVHARIRVKQLHEHRRGQRRRAPHDPMKLIGFTEELDPSSVAAQGFRADERGIWMVPVEQAPAGSRKPATAAAQRRRGMLGMTVNTYLELVDSFGRIVKAGKRAIPAHLKPILERLRVDMDRLTTFLTKVQRFYGTAAGAPSLLKREAQRRQRSRVVSIFAS